ncbi:MAG: hypothetical protein ISS95_00845 [Candidatus Aenigmarchaeota archaeon]|nr:hypothetical protein [Candidatus Aenigmarchaeota archaeon]
MQQLLEPKHCMECKDPCCEFSRGYSHLAPIFTDKEYESIISTGVPKKFFKRVGNSWQVVLTDNGRVYMDCPLVRIFAPKGKLVGVPILNKKICGVQEHQNMRRKNMLRSYKNMRTADLPRSYKICGVQGSKPLMCRLFPFAVFEKKIHAENIGATRASRAHIKKLFLGVYRKGSACYAVGKVDKRKIDKHIEYLKKYLKGMKKTFEKHPELVEKKISDIKEICEL